MSPSTGMKSAVVRLSIVPLTIKAEFIAILPAMDRSSGITWDLDFDNATSLRAEMFIPLIKPSTTMSWETEEIKEEYFRILQVR